VILSAGGAFLQTGPVRFELMLSERSRRELAAAVGEVEVFVTLQLRDDRLELVGFARREERDLYRILRAIAGVGTRMALAILSTLSLRELASAVTAGDVKLLTTVPGVGKKTASRLLLELKDRLAAFLPSDGAALSAVGPDLGPRREQALGALESLGMGRSEALRLLGRLPVDDGMQVEDLIRRALAASAKS